MRLDPTLNYGQLMQAAILLGSVFLIYMNVVRQQDNHALRITAIEKQQEDDRQTLGRIADNVDAIRQDMTIVKFRIDSAQQPQVYPPVPKDR